MQKVLSKEFLQFVALTQSKAFLQRRCHDLGHYPFASLNQIKVSGSVRKNTQNFITLTLETQLREISTNTQDVLLKNILVEIANMKRKLGNECFDVSIQTIQQVREQLGNEATLGDLVEAINKL